jgi:hypothetical protein
MERQLQTRAENQKVNRIEVYWTTMSYKTVAGYVFMLLAVIAAVIYLTNPAWTSATLERIARFGESDSSAAAPVTPGRVRFVEMDGAVKVKPLNSVTWQTAGMNTTLDKGDLIETGPDGLARLSFPDGTTYTVKADTLVTVEENSVAKDKSTNVGVHISTGAVDLATPTWDSPGSKVEISFADATAQMKENSRAAVRTDPTKNENDITVVAGNADVHEGAQSITLGKWERASVPDSGGNIVKSSVLAPPDLVGPLNLQPIIEEDPKAAAVHFEWKEVPEAAEYILHISLSSSFNKVAAEKHVTANFADVTGLDPGDYFWNVTAVAAAPSKKESEPSDTYKFTLVAQGKGQDMLLQVDQTVLHGNMVEIIGRTEPGSALIINGQTVADISADGQFRYFTEPLAKGSQTIVLTGQNRRGGTAIKRVQIVIP